MSEDSAVMEFAVEMSCDGCVKSVKNALQGVDGVKTVNVNLDKGQVLIESTLPSSQVKSLIETTGKRAVLQGYGGTNNAESWESAVVELNEGNKNIKGIVRLVQTDQSNCMIDGTVDGLPSGKHRLFVHECGDMSEGCNSCGEILGRLSPQIEKPVGDLGEIHVGGDGRADFRLRNERLKVWDVIGRSLVVHKDQGSQDSYDPQIQQRLTCGIIARSAGLFQNSAKRICTCDGVTIWDERDTPLVGENRKSKSKM